MTNSSYYLSTTNIYLRALTLDDATDEYCAWLNDNEVNQYLETRYLPTSKADLLNFIESKVSNKNEPVLAICDKNSHKHIGNIKLGPICPYHRHAQVSLLIGNKDFWGKGIATQAIGLICHYAFNILNLNKLLAGAYANNISSIKAFEKCGFIIEGRSEDYYLCQGKSVDLIYLGLSKKLYSQVSP